MNSFFYFILQYLTHHMDRIVIAIGGNTIDSNYSTLHEACNQIAKLSNEGFEVLVTHGNGPQVGNLLLMQENFEFKEPLYVLVAMTQAQIGLRIQEMLYYYSVKKINSYLITTRVIVDEKDESFKNPTKPIGPLYNENEAKKLIESGYFLKKVTMGNKEGYRRVVASPKPLKIIEIDLIRSLSKKGIVICCGGGGVPVVTRSGKIEGTDAVIDKDLTSSLLAVETNSDILLIATNVEKVKLNFMKENEIDLDSLSLDEAKKYLEEGHFLEDSMKPKIISCVEFLEKGGKKAIITSTNKIMEAIKGKAGTVIYS